MRTIKPEVWESPDVLPMDDGFQALWIWLITQADDAGRLHADAEHIAHRRRRPLKAVEKYLTTMESHGMIVRYVVDGKHYLALINWQEHQRVQHPSNRVLPAPPNGPFLNPQESSGGLTSTHESSPLARAQTEPNLTEPNLTRARVRARGLGPAVESVQKETDKENRAGTTPPPGPLAEVAQRIAERSRQHRGVSE